MTSFQNGTLIDVSSLFDSFPARKKFLKRPQYEASNCRQIFIEKALPFFNIHMSYALNGRESLTFYKCSSLKERVMQVCYGAFGFKESESLFFEISHKDSSFSFNIVLGTPDVYRSSKKYIYVFVNGRRINEYGFVQSICYGSEGYFPNGGYPVVFLFLQVDSSRVDFNIHPAKKEAHFEDYHEIHKSIHTEISNFYKQKTIMSMLGNNNEEQSETFSFDSFNFSDEGNLTDNRDVALDEYKSQPIWTENVHSSFNSSINALPINTPIFRKNSSSHFDSSDISLIFPMKQKVQPLQTAEKPAMYGEHFERKEYSFKLLGQFCGTFIAVEKDNALYIIDQHAAHERIIYEALKKSVGASQELLAPYILESPSKKNDDIIKGNIKALENAGFRIAYMGDGRWEISAVPIFYKGSCQNLLEDILNAKDADSLINHLLATASCRAACKDGDILDVPAMCDIVQKAFLLKEPLCPHGRPIYFVLNKLELFKKVKRIT